MNLNPTSPPSTGSKFYNPGPLYLHFICGPNHYSMLAPNRAPYYTPIKLLYDFASGELSQRTAKWLARC